jgi:hypothetical protein
MDLHRRPITHWQWLAAAGLNVTAAVHLAIAPEHLHEAPYAGVLFVALAVAALVAAALVLTTSHPAVWAGATALVLAALVSYFLSRSVGLPSLSDDVGDWLNPLGVIAVVAETIVTVIGLQALRGAGAYRMLSATERLYTVVPASPPSEPAG